MAIYNTLITIIVPVYNVEKYIRDCVDSILNQTYTNIEVILSDDGSTDDSGKICDEYEKKDSRIRVIHKENEGLAEARNRGIDAANGEYICFVDSDDYIKNTYIEYLIDLISKQKAQMAICPLIRDYNGKIKSPRTMHLNKCLCAKEAFDLMFLNRMFIGIYACNKLYKKSMFHNIRFPKGRFFEDSGTIYKLIAKCDKIAYGDVPQYYYRIGREGAITSEAIEKKQKRYMDKLYFLNEMEEYFKSHPGVFSNAFYNTYFGDLLLIFARINREDDPELYCEVRNMLNSHIRNIGRDANMTINVRIKALLFCMSPQLFSKFFSRRL